MKEKTSLTARQIHALPFILSNPNIEQASKLSGVSSKQIFEWLNQPLFKSELDRLRNETVDEAVNKLKSSALKACETLVTLLDDAESASVKHRVAVDILNMTLKFMEFKEVEQRIRKLEESVSE